MKLFLTLIFLITIAIASDIFEYTDQNGNLVLSNIRKANAKEVNLSDVNINAPVELSKEEITRKKILMEELDREKNAYQDANFMLEQALSAKLNAKDNMRYQEHIKLLQNAVTEHQKNIATLTGTLN